MGFDATVNDIAKRLPADWEITIYIRNGCVMVDLTDPYDDRIPLRDTASALSQIDQAVRIAARKGEDTFSLSLYYMRDNHTFTRITGRDWIEIEESARVAIDSDEYGYGSLCPAIIVDGEEKESQPRIGGGFHLYKKSDVEGNEKALALWLADLKANPRVCDLVQKGRVK